MKFKLSTLPKFPFIQSALNILERFLNSGLESDNLSIWKLEGTTHGTADTLTWFKHGLEKTPVIYLSSEGDVYVEKMGQDAVDVRSQKTSEVFVLYLFA